MRILVVGGGGREHALGAALAGHGHELRFAPGNAGTDGLAGPGAHANRPVRADDVAGLVGLALAEGVDLVVVGPEAPLVAGLVDALESRGIAAFGPTAACAALEGSKAYAKQLMARWGVPTAASVTVNRLEDALAALDRFDAVPVVKASGLAAGKGVVVPEHRADAEAALGAMFVERVFGDAASEVVLEERLVGREVSVLAICSDASYRLLVPAQDHKRLLDGDGGPNTGGMGAFAPSAIVDDTLLGTIGELAIAPILDGMVRDGTPYCGVLYAGIMLTDAGPRVLEYNCRFGDPEAQVILALWADDPVHIFRAAIERELDQVTLSWRPGAAATVVMAAEGYPERPVSGALIGGLEAAAATGCQVLHAGTVSSPEGPRVAGGRVLSVTATGADLPAAVNRVYAGVDRISFDGMQFRRDIGRHNPEVTA
ncbi:MAG: phosphoribosylamine--glycine ligase [Acidimicrobiales bacterium]